MARTKQKNHELAGKIGKIIKAQREIAGLTQAQLAEMVGLEDETISRMENGRRIPTVEKLAELAEVLRFPTALFFEAPNADGSQKSSDLYAKRISTLLIGVPEAGLEFVLKVAQDYSKYHVVNESDK
jgi:transcriptional regulator with XRE-family HTH domain